MAKQKKAKETVETQSSDSSYTELDVTPETTEAKPEVIEGPRFIQPKEEKTEGENVSERLLSYLKNRSGGFVKINEFLKQEYKQQSGHQEVNKRLKFDIANLVVGGKVVIKDDTHLTLGSFFYEGNDPKTKYRTIDNTVIEAKLA